MTVSERIDHVLTTIHECRSDLSALMAWKDEVRRNIDRFYASDWNAVLQRIAATEERLSRAEDELLNLRPLPARVKVVEDEQEAIERWRIKVAVYATLGAAAGSMVAAVVVGLVIHYLTSAPL